MNVADVIKTYRLLAVDGQSLAVRCVIKGKGALSASVRTQDEFVAWAKKMNGQGECFVGRNPRDVDEKVSLIRCVSFDFDVVRPKGEPANDAQIEECRVAAERLLQTFPGGSLLFSGNGFHVFYVSDSPIVGNLSSFERAYDRFNSEYLGSVDKYGKVKDGTIFKPFEGKVALDDLYDSARLDRIAGTLNIKSGGRMSRWVSYRPQPRQEIFRAILAFSSVSKGESASNIGSGPVNNASSPAQTSDIAGPNRVVQNRNIYLTEVAGSLRRRGAEYKSIVDSLRAVNNEKCSPPLLDEEVQSIAKSIMRYEPESITGTVLHGISRDIGARLGDVEPLVLHTPDSSRDAFKEWLDEEAKPNEFGSGLARLDAITGGILRGGVHILAARQNVGKTTLAVQTAYHCARAGKRVLYLSTEMTYKEIWSWFVSHATGVNRQSVHRRTMTPEAKQKVREFVDGEFKQMKFTVFDNSMPDIATVSRLLDDVKPDILIFDYIQHIKSSGDNRREELAKFIMWLKNESAKRNIAVLAAAQISRPMRVWDSKTNETVEPPPTLFDLAECAFLEREATVVVLLHRTQDQIDATTPILHAIVAKNRFGPRGDVISLAHHAPFTKFTEI